MREPIATINQPDADPRAALRLAQATAAGSAEAAQDAASAAARGQVAVDATRAVLAAYDGLDARVAGHHAGILRAGEAAGRAVLPADLVKARRAQAAARQEFADAVNAHALLAGEARELAATAERAEGVLWAAADAVAQRDVGRLVQELREVEAEAGKLRVSIGGFLGGRSVSAAPVSWVVSQITHDPQHAHLVDLVRPDWSAASTIWSDYVRRLAADAGATLAVPGTAS